MKKEKRDHLTDLIHSLSVNEKRYFKLTAVLRANSNHKKLFDILDTEPAYDITRIKKRLGSGTINISYEKKHLQKMVLRSMRNYSEDASIEIQLHRLLTDIELLYSKELISFCYQLVQEGLAITDKYELFLYKLHLLKWKRHCLKKMGNVKLFNTYLAEEETLTLDCIAKMSNLITYKKLHQKTYALVSQQGTMLKKKDKEMLAELIKNPQLKDAGQALTILAKVLFYETKAWCCHLLNELPQAYTYSKQIVTLMDSNPAVIQLNPQAYIAALASHYNRSYISGKTDQAELVLQKLEQLEAQKDIVLTENLKREIFYFTSERRVIDYVYSYQFQKAIEQAQKNKKISGAKKMKLRPSNLLLEYYFIALSHFHLKNYEDALSLVRKIINEFDDNIRLDFIFFYSYSSSHGAIRIGQCRTASLPFQIIAAIYEKTKH